MASTGTREEPGRLSRQAAELEPWFHNLHLPDGSQTAPNHFLGDFPTYKWEEIALFFPPDLHSVRVLDIGCNAGFYSLKLAERNASVLAMDMNPHYLRQARWAARQFGVEHKIEFKLMQVYDLAAWKEKFDIVLFLGVFYHLRYPLLGLDIVSRLVSEQLFFQTLTMPGKEIVPRIRDMDIDARQSMNHPGWPKMAFLEDSLAGDRTNWWAANHAGVEAMLRSCGFMIVDRPGKETYVCRPDPGNPSCIQTWNRDEYEAATGISRNSE